MRKQIRLFAAFLLAVLLAGCGTEKVQEPVGQAVEALSQEADIQEADAQGAESRETDIQERDAQGTEDRKTDIREKNSQETEPQKIEGQESDIQETQLQETEEQETQLPETEQKEAQAGDEEAGLEEDEPLSLEEESEIVEDGACSSKEEVAQYLFLYGHLPPNFITKKEAQELGWEGGSLEPFAPGKCIGGSRFGNYEGLLPEKEGRFYTECDIDTLGADRRGAKRIVFSNDGLIYYTEDHYESFELLYGEE